jgi:hypothetical protein
MFFLKLSNLVKKVLPLIDPAIKNTFLPKDIDNYPVLSKDKTGFPSISHYPSRKNISQIFRSPYSGREPEIDLTKFVEYGWLLDAVGGNETWATYFRQPKKEFEDDKSYSYWIADFVESFIERYYYLHGSKFLPSKLKKIYLPAANYLSSETIAFDIAVPILFLKFKPDSFKINDNIYIRKISDEDQRARYSIKAYSPAILDSVYMPATHELVLKNYSAARQSSFYDYFRFSNPSIFPLEIFEQFFTLLKLVTNEDSGYAQILMYPKGWSEMLFADVKYVCGTVVKSYPQYFENFYWTREKFPVITLSQLNDIKKLFNKTNGLPDNKIKIALKRFYKSMMRQEEEDIILDLIIALELLLSDGEKGDITYKLSMRLTALICKYHSQKYNAHEVFNNVKKIYAFRSAVVHGAPQKTTQKSREIKLPDDTSIPAVELAKLYLREILKIMINEPKHLEAKINDLMLLGI